jgi:Tfp pilus assembly protein PilX
MHLIHRCQQGFTTVTLMGVLMVGGMLVAASFAVVDPDISLSQKDDDSKQAYAAAEAGIGYYMNRLAQDTSYYTHCANVPAPTQNAVNLEWNGSGADPRRFRKIPGYQSDYAVELLAVQDTTVAGTELCVEDVPGSMVDPKSGSFRIRATGRARTPTSASDQPKKRSIVATLRRKAFLDYLYFTDRETLDPLAYSDTDDQAWAAANCDAPRQDRPGGCTEINFITADTVAGPLHSNDSILVCGSPTFGNDINDAIEINQNSPGWVSCGGGGTPNFTGTLVYPGGILPMPQSNAELKNSADAGYVFQGETTLVFNGNTVSVTNGGTTVSKALPPSGVIYVESTSCATGYARAQTYAAAPGCGNVRVSGTYNKDITIGADNDIIVMDDFESADVDTVLGGLIANNFVRVYHPVNFGFGCSNAAGGPGSIQIDAAILALNHSFIVDNWYCGDELGTLTVNGAIAQKFRGPVGTFGGGGVTSGYEKDYNYNDTLRYREPPYFVNPTDSPWRIIRQNEQVPAR